MNKDGTSVGAANASVGAVITGLASLMIAASLSLNSSEQFPQYSAISVSLISLVAVKVFGTMWPSKEADRVAGNVGTAMSGKPRARLRAGSHAKGSSQFNPSSDVLVFLSFVSIVATLLWFREAAVEMSSQLGVMYFSWVSSTPPELVQPILQTLSFPELGQALALFGSAVLTVFSTMRLHRDSMSLFQKAGFLDMIVGRGFFGGFLTLLLLWKYILWAVTAIGAVFMVGTFGALFTSWTSRPEGVLALALSAALPFIFMTVPLLLILTLVSSTLSNTMAGIYCYVSFSIKRKRSSA